jgi:hypothetical protein
MSGPQPLEIYGFSLNSAYSEKVFWGTFNMNRIYWVFAFLVLFGGSALACPDYSKSGDTYELTGSELYSVHKYNVRAGGNINIEKCSNVTPQTDRGRGYVTEAPDFTFNLSGMGKYTLTVSVESDCDSVLLVNTASAGWYYDDDDNGNLDAKVNLTRPSDGWLDVWVGTHDGAVCDAMLSMETFDR